MAGLVAGEPSPGGLLSGLFGGGGRGGGGGGWGVPVEYGERTEEKLPPLIKEHHTHSYIKKPHFNVEHSKSHSSEAVKVIHQHHNTQKVIHKHHNHQHVINQHHVHKVRWSRRFRSRIDNFQCPLAFYRPLFDLFTFFFRFIYLKSSP